MIKLKRVYESIADDDGYRVFVERLWPRGISKEKASLDEWMKEISPSPELRKWYAHDVEKWADFKQQYLGELSRSSQQVNRLLELIHQGTVTLVYASQDQQHNSALVLKEFLESKLMTLKKQLPLSWIEVFRNNLKCFHY